MRNTLDPIYKTFQNTDYRVQYNFRKDFASSLGVYHKSLKIGDTYDYVVGVDPYSDLIVLEKKRKVLLKSKDIEEVISTLKTLMLIL